MYNVSFCIAISLFKGCMSSPNDEIIYFYFFDNPNDEIFFICSSNLEAGNTVQLHVFPETKENGD